MISHKNGVPDYDLKMRVEHKIRNLMKLEEKELEYISNIDKTEMFEIIKLFNVCMGTLVDHIIKEYI
jgi:hypothetical protein